MHEAERFIDAVARGAVDEARACLADDASIDDPRAGRITDRAGIERWVADEHAWLAGFAARPEQVRTTVAGRSAVVERLFHVRVKREARSLPLPLPLALVAEANEAGRLVAVRVYHSFWPLEHAHRLRGRILPARGAVSFAPPIDAHQRAYARGDVDGVLACYERRGATLREPAGDPWVHRGPRGLRRVYGTLFSNGGGIALEHANVVDDGVACAIEYTVVRFGRTTLPPQAGLAVYERGASGLIQATRLYDDVEFPRE